MKKKRKLLCLPREDRYKILLKMKLLTVLMGIAFAAPAVTSYSQSTLFNMKMNKATVMEVFQQIEDNSEFILLYNEKILDVNREVNVNVKSKTIESVLDQVFEGTANTYKIYNRQIVILASEMVEPLMNGSITSQPVQKQIYGIVKDNKGLALPGVSVRIKNTSIGIVTDADGKFRLSIPFDAKIVQFSFVGMREQEIPVAGRTSFDIVMEDETFGVDEVVVTALGLKREKKALGYSVGEVKGDDVTETSQGNVLNALAGKVAGVKINQMDGTAGSSVNMVIRGAKSLNNDNQPLFVIDGVPVRNQLNNLYEGADLGNAITDLNPNDIESISVLKGASAAALYGSRAGNGVVLITTRTGAKAKKGIGVSFNTTNVLEVPYHYIPIQNTFASGKAGSHKLDESANESWGAQCDIGSEFVQWNSNGVAVPLVSYPDRFKDFFQNGFTTTNNVAVDGNYDEGYFRLSVGDMRNEGIIPNTELNRSTINLNAGYNITDKIKVTANFNWTESGSDSRPNVDGEDRNGICRSLYEMSCHVNVMDLKDYWVNGQEGIQQLKYKTKHNNVWFLAHENTNAFSRDRLTSKVKAEWQLTNELSLSGSFARDSYLENRESKKAFSTYGQVNGGYNLTDVYRKETNIDLNLAYRKQLNENWNLSAFIAGNRMYAYARNIVNDAAQLVIPELYTIANGVSGDVDYSSSWSEKAIYSAYGMASIGYKNRIYLDLTARNDWSSTLPADSRSYFYPSASLSVLLSEVFTMPEWISYTKIRAGIAQVGNDTSPYSLTQAFTITDDWGTEKRIYMGGSLKNPNLVPEKATSKEIGADFKFLNDKIGFEVTYYTVENENQVLSISLPVETGATSKYINAGLIESSGWEIGLNATPVETKNFRWDLNVNFSRNRTKLKELAEGITNFGFGSVQGAMFRCYEGDYIGDIYEQPMLTVTDEKSVYYGYPLLTNDGKYQTDTDANHMKKIGNSNPDFNIGFQPSIRYKAFSLYANIDWSQGGEFYSETMMFFNNNGWLENSFSGAAYDRDRNIEEQIKENPQAYFGEWLGGRNAEYGGFAWPTDNGRPDDASFNVGVREVVSGGVKNYVENMGGSETKWLDPFNANQKANRPFPHRNLYSATYVKLREIALTWHLPQKWNEKMHLSRSSVALVANNIMEWTKANIDIDPERIYMTTNGSWLQGVEYYNIMPWTATVGVKLNLEF